MELAAMSDWINVSDRIPEENKLVKFLHHNYEFKGICHHKPFPFQDILSEREYPNWYFTGSQGQGNIITCEVTKWCPIDE